MADDPEVCNCERCCALREAAALMRKALDPVVPRIDPRFVHEAMITVAIASCLKAQVPPEVLLRWVVEAMVDMGAAREARVLVRPLSGPPEPPPPWRL